MIRHTFKKPERLTSKKTFAQLFKSGKSISVSPFRLVWIETTLPSPISPLPAPNFAQLGISVPKKSFTRAVDRNTLKRRIRESYRKNKHLLYEALQQKCGNHQNKNHSIAFMFIYTAKEQLPYSEIEKKMVVSLQKLIHSIKQLHLNH